MALKIRFRFWIAVMIFFTTFMNYVMRANLSMSLIAMTNLPPGRQGQCSENGYITTAEPTTEPPENETTTLATETTTEETVFHKFDYSQREHGQLLAAYGYGYVIFSPLGGFLSEYFGPWKVIFWSNFVSIILTFGCVGAAFIHWGALFFVRFLIGSLGGLVYPALQITISRWSPPNEKGKFLSCMMGNTLGTAMIFPLVGGISQALNWAWGFWLTGILVSVYLLGVIFILSDSPSKSKLIPEEEREYLLSVIPPPKNKLVAPYLKIFGSVAFWGLMFAHIANLYGLFVMVLSAPKFFKEYLNQDLKKSGFFSALPQLCRMFSAITLGIVVDAIEAKEWISVTVLRKSFIIVSHLIPGVAAICIMFCECSWVIALCLLVLMQTCNGAVVATTLHNPQDLAPNYAGTIFGIVSLVGGTTQFIVPAITGELLQNDPNAGLEKWRWVFIIAGCIYILGGFLFICFASGKRQSWNEPKESTA
ncbi:unnamed protein product [Brassicogethes aeneus]|uniref:Major facilitator superfamily (MFS) profile domain-containing protein n=1 Tax=Brassicogethes aeneus TaxID=1431903 RepID=A0A9P0BHN2_BRAAE|nr:unnamed protein product [Brassicogethes aeneus]